MKNPLCILGFHRYGEWNRVFTGGDGWLKQLKCTRCGFIKKEEVIRWKTTNRPTL